MIKFYMEDAGRRSKRQAAPFTDLRAGRLKSGWKKTVPISWRNRSGSLCFCALQSSLTGPMIIVLLAAALVSGITAFYAGGIIADVIIILAVVVINAVLGVYQESKAEKSHRSAAKDVGGRFQGVQGRKDAEHQE